MSFDYLNEAFKKLDLLKEETFDTSPEGLSGMKSFMEMDLEDDTIRVIDAEAEVEDDLQDSYIGKVIINCNVCHSNIFENKEDIVIDEDGSVNPEDQCPYCGEQLGFTIKGEVTEYVAPSDDETKVTVDGEEVPVEEAPVETSDVIDEEPLEESLIGTAVAAAAGSILGNKLSEEDEDPNDEASEEEPLEEGKRQYKPHTLKILKMLDEEPLTEAVNNVNVETDDSIVNIQSEEDGKVTVSTEPKEPEVTEEEAIGPVSDETMAEIEAANSSEEEFVEEPEFEEVSDEGEAEEADEFEDVDFDEVDEESFDDLGEAYLKRVYENVDSFKTTSVSENDNKLIVEGVITFNSGSKKSTGFVFEAHSSANGKVRFTGMNEHFSRGSKSFALTGRVENKKLISESLSYNYRAKVGNGKSTRIYGTVNK